MLATAADKPADWVAAGQALQRLLLVSLSQGARVAIHSQPAEFPALREFIRSELAGGGWPQLVLRFGAAG